MSLQFSRSMRVLRLDSYRVARLGLVVAGLLMAALIGWFFLARVTLYEVSAAIEPGTARMGTETQMVAEFPKEALTRIRAGQSAWLRLDGAADQQAVRLPALIYEVPPGGSKVIFVVLSPGFSAAAGGERLKGRLEVEVERVTPAQLVMRSSGQIMNQGSSVPVSQQNAGSD